MRVGTSGNRSLFSIIPIAFNIDFTPAGFPSTNNRLNNSVNLWWIASALAKSPWRAKRVIRLNSRGKAFPITEITPTAPKVIRGKVMPSSPGSWNPRSDQSFAGSGPLPPDHHVAGHPTQIIPRKSNYEAMSMSRHMPYSESWYPASRRKMILSL